MTKKELAAKLQRARKNAGINQQDAASHLGLPRSAVSQIESGNREISALELSKLADLYGYKVSDFFTEEFQEIDISVLLRAIPQTEDEEKTRRAIKKSVNIIREIITLRELLGRKNFTSLPPSYQEKHMTTKLDAVIQGKKIAKQERQRLELGTAAVENLPMLLEKEGVMVMEMDLPDNLSGMTFKFRNSFTCAVNSAHTYERKRFSLAHEYCHSLCDLSVKPIIRSLTTNQKELEEVRANAFATEFLIPQDGVRNYMASMGKGYPSRPSENIFYEGPEEMFIEGRVQPETQEINLWDVNYVAKYFHVSRDTTMWQMVNMKIITKEEREKLADEAKSQYGRQIGKIVGYGNDCNREKETFRSACVHLLCLGSIALGKEIISRDKFLEAADMAGFGEEEVLEFVGWHYDFIKE